MTIWMVESGGTITLFDSREVAEQSISKTWSNLVGEGYLASLDWTLSEVHVHDKPFEVRSFTNPTKNKGESHVR